jgi:hypothetical protein
MFYSAHNSLSALLWSPPPAGQQYQEDARVAAERARVRAQAAERLAEEEARAALRHEAGSKLEHFYRERQVGARLGVCSGCADGGSGWVKRSNH